MSPIIHINTVAFCKALADETRQSILELLIEGEKCVSDIVKHFKTSQPTISHHLALLNKSGLVIRRKRGKRVYYDAHRENLIEACDTLLSTFGYLEHTRRQQPRTLVDPPDGVGYQVGAPEEA